MAFSTYHLSDKLIKSVGEELRQKSITIGDNSIGAHTIDGVNQYPLERLIEDDFEDNDAYKVCYRFLDNMLAGWRSLGLPHFPSISEAITIAKEASPYFAWLLAGDDEEAIEKFTNLYTYFEDVWRDMEV